jgi:inositol-phosphate phosphatase / L-galactose 1-phosphate phosphatase / histidinol-phosphatase
MRMPRLKSRISSSQKKLSADLALAQRLADAAGAAIRPYFRAEFGLELKADRTPVTLADRAAEAAMRVIIERERPLDGIIGEEYGSVREGAARTWVLDPIDGTRSFVAGRPIFGTLIALVEEGVPVLGVIDQPIAGERWVGAAGLKTLFNNKPCRTRACATLSDVIMATTSPAAFPPHDFAAFEALIPQVRDTLWGGDCYNYGLVALGQIDIVIESGLKLHDFAALVPVVEGAGGAMRDWRGKRLTSESDGRVIAVGDDRLIQLATLNS